ncbi:MAG: YlbF family regulator [Lachnospiraceae bacterium]|nr:YlbF family regulator [Lachnospiraceae bacterium]MBQ9863598.1 YlbF family regulator [Lachnospiraceae bacterium]MCR4932563.1 YlbF family regulator [Lachnospiraceae bacterium]
MTDLTALCSHVVSEICQTPEYRQYEETLKQLKKDEPLYKRVTEYREKNFALQQSDSEDLLDLLDALTNEYEDVINIELASDFIEAEVALCRLVQNFNKDIIAGLNFE